MELLLLYSDIDAVHPHGEFKENKKREIFLNYITKWINQTVNYPWKYDKSYVYASSHYLTEYYLFGIVRLHNFNEKIFLYFFVSFSPPIT